MGRMSMARVVGGLPYYVHPHVLGVVNIKTPLPLQTAAPAPAVIISSAKAKVELDEIQELLRLFREEDDVYNDGFHASLILQTVGKGAADNEQHLEHVRSSGLFTTVMRTDVASVNDLLPSGPYFLDGQNIHQAWRLYEDDLDAFVVSIVPETFTPNSSFKVLDSTSPEGIWKQVAVPSRLYHRASTEQPLAGRRLSIKDVFHVAGIKTTLSSRDYTSLYGPQAQSADFVRTLVELGAIIVGKTKTTSFASSDEPTDQWIDFHCPTNPRGDRYQSPSGSTTGGAASLAGYSWLDSSIGADTAGSIRAPATSNGLFSLRTSYESTSMKGIQANSPGFDVVGLLERSLDSMLLTASSAFGFEAGKEFPSRIIYPTDFFPHSNSNQQVMVEEFVCILENFLNVKRTRLSIIDEWAKNPPREANGKSLKDYVAKSAFWPMCHDYYHLFDNFRTDFEARFNKRPFMGSIVEYRWGVGRDMTQTEADQGWEEQRVFRSWFNTHIMTVDDRSMSNAIMIMPYGSGRPKYRDVPNEKPSSFHTLNEKFISPVLHLPQLVIPIGQNSYDSKISGRQEHRPIATTIMGAQGSDLMLIHLATRVLAAAGWPTNVLTGRYTFELGNNTRNVKDNLEKMPSTNLSYDGLNRL